MSEFLTEVGFFSTLTRYFNTILHSPLEEVSFLCRTMYMTASTMTRGVVRATYSAIAALSTSMCQESLPAPERFKPSHTAHQ